jgi:hypothetical protein
MNFTAQERGAAKHKFTRHKCMWDIIRSLIHAGHTAQTVIDCIDAVYGQQSTVTSILNSVGRDRQNNTLHPDLVV